MAAAAKNPNTQLLDELEALSESMYQTHTSTTRRNASLVLPRSTVVADAVKDDGRSQSRPRSRRLSLSPFRSRPKLDDDKIDGTRSPIQPDVKKLDDKAEDSTEKKGIWNWKPIRALTHVGMQKLNCLFSVEVVTAQGLPASMNGLRLSVCIRKKETKDGAVHTMPSRVSQGAADFEETLFLKCHVYCTAASGKQLKFEPRPFLIYLFAVDAEELDFGKTSVDLTHLIKESMEKNTEGTRVRQWDTSFNLSGKAKGGELVLKLGFQLIEKDGGIDIYSQGEGTKSGSGKLKSLSSAFGRKQSKMSFSVPSPRMTSRNESWTPSRSAAGASDLQGIDELNLDEPEPETSPAQKSKEQESQASPAQILKEPEPKQEDDILDFEVVDKGVELQDEENESEDNIETRSVASSEVVKEIVHDPIHLNRLSELDSIAQQLKALESMMGDEKSSRVDEDSESQGLDEDEETVTREFLDMLQTEESKKTKSNLPEKSEASKDDKSKVYLPDLGKGLGCVVQTKNGGYLASMNPMDSLVKKRDTPKLAMQLSKPIVLTSNDSISGFELFQRMAALGFEELSTQALSHMPMDELMGKTAEQIAFEGMASAIIQGRNKEGASSTAARTVAVVKTMATAMTTGRKERISTGIWNIDENPLTVEEVLALSLQKVETMALEGLKIQADMTDEDSPFDVAPKDDDNPLANAVPLEDWIKSYNPEDKSAITLVVVVQLRDPLRRYESVGGPMMALVQATNVEFSEDEEKRYKIASMHVGGLKVRTGRKRNVWDTEKHRLTAIQWLVAYGFAKTAKKGRQVFIKGQDLLWSTSSRIVADMWLKATRNPDVKFAM
ncbi:hypothetical protein ACFE04_026014 [Oxalis oulophora]